MKIEEDIKTITALLDNNYFPKQIERSLRNIIAHSQNCGVSEEEIEKFLKETPILERVNSCMDCYYDEKALAKSLSSLPLRKEVRVEEISSIVYKILNNKIFEKEDGAVIMPPSQSCGLSNSIAQAIIDHLKGM